MTGCESWQAERQVAAMQESGKQGDVVLAEAVSLPDFLYCRQLRNRVRFNMTGDTEPISLPRQLKFWWRRPPNLALYIARVDGRRAGYLLLRDQGDTALITEAVDDAFRRRGVGAAMIRFAQARHADITADILATNAASLGLHRACGFLPVDAPGAASPGAILTLRWVRPSRSTP